MHKGFAFLMLLTAMFFVAIAQSLEPVALRVLICLNGYGLLTLALYTLVRRDD